MLRRDEWRANLLWMLLHPAILAFWHSGILETSFAHSTDPEAGNKLKLQIELRAEARVNVYQFESCVALRLGHLSKLIPKVCRCLSACQWLAHTHLSASWATPPQVVHHRQCTTLCTTHLATAKAPTNVTWHCLLCGFALWLVGGAVCWLGLARPAIPCLS